MDFGFNALVPSVIEKASTTFESFSLIVYLIGGSAIAFLLISLIIKIGSKVKGR